MSGAVQATLLLAAALLAGCRAAGPASHAASPGAAPTDTPYVVLLGTAQDAGLPQTGCRRACCESAREDPSRRRRAVSLLLVDPRTGRRWLFDAGPDFREQVELAREHAEPDLAGGRPPLFDGVFLTHAHIGHYLGLAHLGREAYAAEAQRVYATRSLGEFLRTNGPWDLLVRAEHVRLEELAPGGEVALAEDLSVQSFAVPHRHEHSDTVGYRIRGPQRSVLFLPDIDKWELWEEPVEEWLARVDVAFLDGTFHASGEVGGRDMASIPHPFITESLARFRDLPAAERAKVRFFHLNHSNPAADPASDAAREVRDAGMHVAAELEVHGL